MFKDKLLRGVVFIGPFRCQSSLLPSDSLCVQSRITPEMEKEIEHSLQRLPLLDANSIKDVMNLGLLLSAYLDRIMAAINFPEITCDLSRKKQIEKFVADNFLNAIRLPDVACFLGVSLSRTSQLLKAYFAESLAIW